jgi:hypothetical protein
VRVRPEPSIKTTPMDDGGLVLLSPRSGRLFRCNATAAAMWAALGMHDGRLDAAAAAVAARYRTGTVYVRADLDVFVERLQRAGLVRTDS